MLCLDGFLGFETRMFMFKAKGSLSNGNADVGIVRTVTHLFVLYAVLCLTTEENARRNLSQGIRKVPVGTVQCVFTVAFVGTGQVVDRDLPLIYLFIETSQLHLKQPVLAAQ